MTPKKILIIEDDRDISELLTYNLAGAGFDIAHSADGESALSIIKKMNPDLVLLDLMLPGMDGLSVCRKIREDPGTKSIPVIMITAKGEETDVVVGLEVGADDYITKPFSPKELIARVRALLRRQSKDFPTESSLPAEEILESGCIKIDLGRHEVRLNDSPLKLTLAEFNLLAKLVEKPGRVFSREKLLDIISGGETYLVDRNVDVHIRSIRKKLGANECQIETVRGVGYKWKD